MVKTGGRLRRFCEWHDEAENLWNANQKIIELAKSMNIVLEKIEDRNNAIVRTLRGMVNVLETTLENQQQIKKELLATNLRLMYLCIYLSKRGV